MNSLRGHFLVASPHLPDPNFNRTVVLMVHHDEHGAFGLVLNRPTDATLDEVWRQVSDTPIESRQPIFLGGPVPGPLMAIHTHAQHADDDVIPGVYLSSQKEHMETIVEENLQPFLMFSGYSGWGEGQLEGEMEMGGWLTAPATREAIFTSENDELWKRVVSGIGDDILRSAVNIDQFPDDPSLN
jgi:putative transcriptional regulator